MEKANSTVPLKRNVSMVEKRVIRLSVSTMESVVEKNLANVLIVSTDQLKLTQQRKQTTKTSVVLSEANKPSVLTTISLTTNQEPVVSLQRNGALLPMVESVLVSNVPTLKLLQNSRQVSTNHTSRVLAMVTSQKLTSDTVSPKREVP